MTKAEGERLARLEEAMTILSRDVNAMTADVRTIRDAMLTDHGTKHGTKTANERIGNWVKNIILAIATLGAGYLGAEVHTRVH